MSEQLSIGDRLEIDAVCDRFESAWLGQPPPEIEEFLSFEGEKQARLFVELVQLDLHYRRLRGDVTSFGGYRVRFPAYARLLEEMGRTVVAVKPNGGNRSSEWTLVPLEGSADASRHSMPGSGSLRLGRDPKLEICLSGDSKVSAEHARLDWSTSWCRVKDLESKNGVYVNEVRVTEAWLHEGDVLRIGRTSFRIERSKGT